MKTPVLETERLILRPLQQGDARAVFEAWESDPKVARYMFWTSHNDINKSFEWVNEEISKISADDWYRWVFITKNAGELVGTGLLYLEAEYDKFEVSYNLSRKAWGMGYTTEAMREILRFAKEELGIKEIMGRHAKENPASGKVLEKLGFTYNKDIPYECNRGQNIYVGKEYRLTL
jgi:ribosomal-protein-alanine N-acetyltransferase